MSNFFSTGWITKIGGLMTLVGGMMAANGDLTYGPALVGVGGLITSFAARQVNVSSEQAGIKSPEVIISVTPPIVEILKAPITATATRSRDR